MIHGPLCLILHPGESCAMCASALNNWACAATSAAQSAHSSKVWRSLAEQLTVFEGLWTDFFCFSASAPIKPSSMPSGLCPCLHAQSWDVKPEINACRAHQGMMRLQWFAMISCIRGIRELQHQFAGPMDVDAAVP